MGVLHYGLGMPIGRPLEIDDRTLAHFQIVMVTKLRRGETFVFEWASPPSAGSGRTTLWMAPAIPLRFEYHGSRAPQINREWLELLAATAQSLKGLHLVEEPAATGPSAVPPALAIV
jgi:hypothetical protein